jgi:hypothetical protein
MCVEKDDNKRATFEGGPVDMPTKQFLGDTLLSGAEQRQHTSTTSKLITTHKARIAYPRNTKISNEIEAILQLLMRVVHVFKSKVEFENNNLRNCPALAASPSASATRCCDDEEEMSNEFEILKFCTL